MKFSLIAALLLNAFSATGFSSPALANERNLGKPLPLALDSSGAADITIQYTYGDDEAGSNYRISGTFKRGLPSAGETYWWNIYSQASDSYLMDWSPNHRTDLVLLTAKINSTEKNASQVISSILKGQNTANQTPIYFVVAKKDQTPLYFISLTELCTKNADHFGDLSAGKACSQINP